MADLNQLVESTIAPMGYELVYAERAGRGLLRITIDRADGSGERIKIEDCERVSRQLTNVFMVEGVDYARLEVGSAGVDRPLRRLADFQRFAGENSIVKLRVPLAGRKNFEGVLQAPEGEGPDAKLSLVFKGKDGTEQVLDFVLSDIERANLNPALDFGKGKK
jgi:ribosome maturation factor RimP